MSCERCGSAAALDCEPLPVPVPVPRIFLRVSVPPWWMFAFDFAFDFALANYQLSKTPACRGLITIC